MSYEELLRRYAQEANAYAAKFGIDPGKDQTNNAWDAFRHGYASAAMTREYGSLPAELFGNLYEIYGDYFRDQKSFEKNMDLWNNAVGRGLGSGAANSDEIANRVYDALKRGDLITDPKADARNLSNFGSTVALPYPDRVYPGDGQSFGLPTGVPSTASVNNPATYYDAVRQPVPPPPTGNYPLSQEEVEQIRRRTEIPKGGLL